VTTILPVGKFFAYNFTGPAYAIWTGVGLIYDVVYPDYYIEGILYPGATEQLTLAIADSTNPRLDVIAVDSTGAIQKTGTASPDPAAPSIDTQTEIYITTILIAAGATTPSGVSNINIYKENVEWSHISELPITNFDATTDPYEGVKHIDIGAFTTAGAINFTDVVSHPIPLDGIIGFRANLKKVFSNNTKFLLSFFNFFIYLKLLF